jgi:hypothetical protein
VDLDAPAVVLYEWPGKSIVSAHVEELFGKDAFKDEEVK